MSELVRNAPLLLFLVFIRYEVLCVSSLNEVLILFPKEY